MSENGNEILYFRLQIKAELSNKQASMLFEVNVTTIRRWRSNRIPAPKAVILCLESMISGEPVPRYTGDVNEQ